LFTCLPVRLDLEHWNLFACAAGGRVI